MSVRIRVYGKPQPAGSKTALPTKGGRTVVVDGSTPQSRKAHGMWRQDVVAAARAVLSDGTAEPFPPKVALRLDVLFLLPRPKSAVKKNPPPPIVRPDTTKLLRAVEDALTTAGLWPDDAQVTDQRARKRYVDPPIAPGCVVEVDLDPDGIEQLCLLD